MHPKFKCNEQIYNVKSGRWQYGFPENHLTLNGFIGNSTTFDGLNIRDLIGVNCSFGQFMSAKLKYRKDAEPLYHYFMYSLVSLLSGIFSFGINSPRLTRL